MKIRCENGHIVNPKGNIERQTKYKITISSNWYRNNLFHHFDISSKHCIWTFGICLLQRNYFSISQSFWMLNGTAMVELWGKYEQKCIKIVPNCIWTEVIVVVKIRWNAYFLTFEHHKTRQNICIASISLLTSFSSTSPPTLSPDRTIRCLCCITSIIDKKKPHFNPHCSYKHSWMDSKQAKETRNRRLCVCAIVRAMNQ